MPLTVKPAAAPKQVEIAPGKKSLSLSGFSAGGGTQFQSAPPTQMPIGSGSGSSKRSLDLSDSEQLSNYIRTIA